MFALPFDIVRRLAASFGSTAAAAASFRIQMRIAQVLPHMILEKEHFVFLLNEPPLSNVQHAQNQHLGQRKQKSRSLQTADHAQDHLPSNRAAGRKQSRPVSKIARLLSLHRQSQRRRRKLSCASCSCAHWLAVATAQVCERPIRSQGGFVLKERLQGSLFGIEIDETLPPKTAAQGQAMTRPKPVVLCIL
ncbi:MAG: hypothetical protein AAFQ05_08315, partial [Pseudomonadota bacterium]